MDKSSAFSTALRCLVALVMFVAPLVLIALKSENAKLISVVFAFPMLVLYCLLGYVLRPKPRRNPRTAKARRTRGKLIWLKFVLWPGRFIVVSIVDFAFMLVGKQAAHNIATVEIKD